MNTLITDGVSNCSVWFGLCKDGDYFFAHADAATSFDELNTTFGSCSTKRIYVRKEFESIWEGCAKQIGATLQSYSFDFKFTINIAPRHLQGKQHYMPSPPEVELAGNTESLSGDEPVGAVRLLRRLCLLQFDKQPEEKIGSLWYWIDGVLMLKPVLDTGFDLLWLPR